MKQISNGNDKTEWSPIRSVIIRVINKIERLRSRVRFVYHEYDYRQNWKTRSENNNLREMYLRIKEEKQIITKKGSSTQGVI